MKAMFSILLFCLLFAVSVFAQEARKFDEFGYINCEDYLARMDNAIVHARDNPSVTVYVFIYEGREPVYNRRTRKEQLMLPVAATIEAKIITMRRYLTRYKLPVERFSLVKAGFRENAAVELWTVPNGAAPPKPTPTLTKMKYRKGKPRWFCTGCC
jgi:hypothetical protein